MKLNRRARKTLAAAARTLVPAGEAIPQGADDLGLVDALVDEIESYPHRARRRTRLLLLATSYLPLASGHLRRFSALPPAKRLAVLERNGRHPRSPLRRLIVSYLKQLVYSSYISQPAVEDAVGYRYECVKPLPTNTTQEGSGGTEEKAEERVHH